MTAQIPSMCSWHKPDVPFSDLILPTNIASSPITVVHSHCSGALVLRGSAHYQPLLRME